MPVAASGARRCGAAWRPSASRGHARARAGDARAHGSLGRPQRCGVDVEPKNGLDVSLVGPGEAVEAIRKAHESPSFVPLEVLAIKARSRGSVRRARIRRDPRAARGDAARRRAASLQRYGGRPTLPRHARLSARGRRWTERGVPERSRADGRDPRHRGRARRGLAARGDRCELRRDREHAFGHGSIEYAAALARRHPTSFGARRLTTGRSAPTTAIEAMHRRYGCANLTYAVEGTGMLWDAATGRFVRG